MKRLLKDSLVKFLMVLTTVAVCGFIVALGRFNAVEVAGILLLFVGAVWTALGVILTPSETRRLRIIRDQHGPKDTEMFGAHFEKAFPEIQTVQEDLALLAKALIKASDFAKLGIWMVLLGTLFLLLGASHVLANR